MIVTIDGPAGTGKSTVARQLARELNFQFLDTGAMYRMIALKFLRSGTDVSDTAELVRLAVETEIDLSSGSYIMDGEDVVAQIRTADVTSAASLVAQVAEVRAILVQRQREIAHSMNIVCEGRDQGTVAFPFASCKFFLTASPEERAMRRLSELKSQGKQADFGQILEEQTARDERDRQRTVSPLRPADDAMVVDTTSLNLSEVVKILRERIEQYVQSRPSKEAT
jgi:cytidylate kinase